MATGTKPLVQFLFLSLFLSAGNVAIGQEVKLTTKDVVAKCVSDQNGVGSSAKCIAEFSPTLAAEWEAAADKGDADAMYLIGRCYEDGYWRVVELLWCVASWRFAVVPNWNFTPPRRRTMNPCDLMGKVSATNLCPVCEKPD